MSFFVMLFVMRNRLVYELFCVSYFSSNEEKLRYCNGISFTKVRSLTTLLRPHNEIACHETVLESKCKATVLRGRFLRCLTIDSLSDAVKIHFE